jgi:exodeoxyribonuclease-3
MRIISFNVNGIKSMTGKLKNGEKKGSPTNNVIRSLIEEQQPDLLCLQELKTQSLGDLAWLKTHYSHVYTNLSKHKKGYSGVALLCKEDPEWVETDFNRYDSEFIGSCPEDIAHEGRMVVAKFSTYIVVTVYTPNAQPDLVRIKERIQWESVLRMYLLELRREFGLNVILCGDLNCAHHEIDIHNPKSNKGSPGFSLEERREFQLMLDSGLVDSFRHLHPNTVQYSYFSNFARSRERGVGWRIDYVLVSDPSIIQGAAILGEYFGSDHVPVLLDFAC